jgi:hypothetical protein
MRMKLGELWICMNSECGCEVFVARTAKFTGASNPLCCCGGVMKKPNVRPMAKELSPVISDGPPLKMFRSMLRGRIVPN